MPSLGLAHGHDEGRDRAHAARAPFRRARARRDRLWWAGIAARLPQLLAKMLGVPVYVASDPLTAVVRGTGIVTEDPRPWESVFIDEEPILAEA
jgi:hypothetical protein